MSTTAPEAPAQATAEPPADPAVEPAVDPGTGSAADPVCAAAVDLARAAAREAGGDAVGEHLGVEAEGAYVVTHAFAAGLPGYRGWRWAVTVARAEDSDRVTVDEVVLLPGAEALVAPAWVPYTERIRPGDLAPGDLLPPAADDPRLVPAYTDPETEDLLFELDREVGLGRLRALSLEGRTDAAERWYDGDRGPSAPLAKAAPDQCHSCGFLVPLAGPLRQAFGVCANGFAPDDGRVVSLDHGCGAHSEVFVEPVQDPAGPGMAVEDDAFDLMPVREPRASGEHAGPPGPEGHSHGTVEDADPAEPFGHS